MNEENLQLGKQVDELERTLQKLCRRCCAGDMEKRQLLITYLEQQVAMQQKEWELQKQVMAKEKTRALHAAHFATQKLLETVDDFQNQVETQKRVQRMLAGMLQEKEEKLRYVSSQVSYLCFYFSPKVMISNCSYSFVKTINLENNMMDMHS